MTGETIDARLIELGIVLPAPLAMPGRNRRPYFLAGNTLYLSGHGSALLDADVGPARIGKVSTEVSVEAARDVARAVGIKMLATIADAVGSLDRVAQVLKLTGFINGDKDFTAPNEVMNGASDLFVEVFGPERGRHCRSAIGAGTLVGRQSVEIEGIVLVA